jgi:hypothetical protein
MAHPNFKRPDGRCRICGDKLSKTVRPKNGKRAFCRHRTNKNCPTNGTGEPM